MPVTIYSTNFDSATPPALPAGVTSEGDIVTTTSQKRSGVNGSTNNSGSFGRVLYTNSQDGNNGDAQMSGAFLFHGASADGIAELLCRIQSAPLATCYRVIFDRAAGGITLYSRSGGSQATVGTIGGAAFTDDVWYYATLKTSGSTISVRISRDSDGKYFHPTGSWLNTTPIDCISETDTVVGAGQGNGGVRFNFSGSTANTVYMDDLLFESLASATFRSSPPSVPSNNSDPIVLSLIGTGTAWSGETFTISGAGTTKVTQSITDGTNATLTITTSSSFGIATISDGTLSTTISVGLGGGGGLVDSARLVC